MTPVLEEALILRGWGLAVFPVTKKKPRVKKWQHFQHRRPTDHEIASMFAQPGVDGVGVLPGWAGLANRDFDDPAAYRGWAAGHPDLAQAAPTVATSRGFHVWVRSPYPVYAKLADGELIGDRKHYAVMPPSRHPSGTIYRWLKGLPMGPSEFPMIDPVKAGFLARANPRTAPRGDTRHFGSSPASSAALEGYEGAEERELPHAVRECVLRTLPDRQGQRNGKLHQLARGLRDLIPDDAPPGLLYDAVHEWWRLALPVIGTKGFELTRADFRRAWSAVRVPISISRPKMALSIGAAVGTDSRSRLLAACRALAVETGGAFYLSVRTAGAAVGVKRSQAARLLAALVADGSLRLVQPGRPSKTARRASVYRLPPEDEKNG